MNWHTNKIIITGILVLLFVLSIWLPNALVKPVAALNGSTQSEPDYFIENFTTTTMDEQGRPKYILHAQKMMHYPNNNSAQLEQPQLTQFSPDAPPVHTRADKGEFHKNGKELLMLGNVRVVRGSDNQNPGGDVSANELRIFLN